VVDSFFRASLERFLLVVLGAGVGPGVKATDGCLSNDCSGVGRTSSFFGKPTMEMKVALGHLG
jgi:hypothetical protein